MTTNIEIIENNFKLLVQKIFNNWSALRLCVEHGMGGRNGHQTAIEIMNYIYEYCIQNENITKGELKDILDEIMDQEFNTICEDNSTAEISALILKYIQLVKLNNNTELLVQLANMKCEKEWLNSVTNINIVIDDESDEDEESESTDSEMEVDDITESKTQNLVNSKSRYIEEEDGWTTIRSRRDNLK